MSTEEITARLIAHRMMLQAKGMRRPQDGMLFSVLTQGGKRKRQPPPFEFHWRRMNAFGVTFRDPAVAEAWIANALLAGFSVFMHKTRNGPGWGRGLAHGVYDEDE